MKNLIKMMAALSVTLLVSTGAKAQTVNYAATVTGAFTINGGTSGGGWSVVGGGTQLQDSHGAVKVTFLTTTFNVQTTPPYPTNASIDGLNSSDAVGGLSVGTFGTPAFPSGENLPANVHLTLTVTYTSPVTGQTVYTASVSGQIKGVNLGGVNTGIQFTPDPGPSIPFTIPGYTGTAFDLAVDTRSVKSGQIGYLSGNINATATPLVPESGSLALLLPGLIPLGFILRRRKRLSF